jgi:hypothetical protein
VVAAAALRTFSFRVDDADLGGNLSVFLLQGGPSGLPELRRSPALSNKHFCSARQLAPPYPHWSEFLGVRDEPDSRGMFMNGQLRRALGV